MCGLAGFWAPSGSPLEGDAILRRMAQSLQHRGPDGEGYWSDPTSGIALAHRRLSILDLSPLGSQPMSSYDGRYVIAFNGEIYNFAELRDELQHLGCVFRGRSDTEVLLAALVRWGLGPTLKRSAGMFAFVLWDRQARSLHLARDRFGEKPLYYAWMGRTFIFGSELKALRVHPDWRADIDKTALTLFLRHNYVPAPHSIYAGVRKVRPAAVLTVTADGEIEETEYWSLRETVARGHRSPLDGSDSEVVSELERTLRRTIRQEMVADVPLGAFLSGGVDSSAVVALMQTESTRPVRTFTIGFLEPGYNEAEHAKVVARHLRTDHTELYVTPAQALEVIPRLPTLYDEPFADSSQIPTYLVAELARRHVTVSLSGDGGDELFGGYDRYSLGKRLWTTVGWVPLVLRQMLARAVHAVAPSRWDAISRHVALALPRSRRLAVSGARIHKLADVLAADSPGAVYRSLVTHWPNPATVVVGGSEPEGRFTNGAGCFDASDFVEWMMYHDAQTYLPDDILVKVDRATMGVSLESRAPYLDHRVAEVAWRIPMRLKVGHGQGKRVLRRLLDRYVPRTLTDRPKMGFGVPIDSWLRGPLRGWAEALLSPSRLQREGFFDPAPIQNKWHEHLSGQRNWQYLLWDVLMFQAWLESQA